MKQYISVTDKIVKNSERVDTSLNEKVNESLLEYRRDFKRKLFLSELSGIETKLGQKS